ADRETSLRRDAAPAKARATKAAAPDTATMTERPAISPAVFSLRHRHNLRTATTLFGPGGSDARCYREEPGHDPEHSSMGRAAAASDLSTDPGDTPLLPVL